LLKDGFVVNTILKEADLFCPNSVRINFTIYLIQKIVYFKENIKILEYLATTYPPQKHSTK
ncbi:hypothetical protein, partial [Levilactobacillus brevis]|uniref:hypothetical protein n=1 Tax=Levilactobacillus brevis TaxID=1580 RepID=UPI0021A5DC16